MLTCENEIVDRLTTLLTVKFEGIMVTSEYTELPPVFPFVSVSEDDNTIASEHSETLNTEQSVRVLYRINVYSNKAVNRKMEAVSIADETDRIMTELGFVRTMKQPMPNADRAIYRIILEYKGRVEKITTESNILYKVYGD